jgi:ankyrin repeat protein
MKGSVPMVELLLRNGAIASVASKEGDTPVELALRFGHVDAADLLRRSRQGGDADDELAVPQTSG